MNTHFGASTSTPYIEFHSTHRPHPKQVSKGIEQKAKRDLGDTPQAKLNRETDGEQGLKRRAARAARNRAAAGPPAGLALSMGMRGSERPPDTK